MREPLVRPPEREVARLKGFDIADDDHGGLTMAGAFEYDGAGQGLGLRIDTDFVQRFMKVFRVERLQQVNGKACWVTHTNDKVLKIEPLRSCEGEAFDIAAWCDAKRREVLA